MSLEKLQELFVKKVTAWEELDGKLSSFELSLLSNQKKEQKGLTPLESFQVYQEAYFVRLQEALEDMYPNLSFFLKEKGMWDAVSFSFIEKHPSLSPSLSDYGRGFPEFLEAFLDGKWPFLKDLALAEFFLHEAFFVPLPHQKVLHALEQALPDQRSSFSLKLHASVHLFSSFYKLQDFLKGKYTDLKPSSERHFYLIYKAYSKASSLKASFFQTPVRLLELPFWKWAWLSSFQSLFSFEKAFQKQAELIPVSEFQTFFAFCLREGLFDQIVFL